MVASRGRPHQLAAFFEVSGLIGVRVERDDVFEAVHELVLRLYAEGVVDGLRVDHVDGLAQPLDHCRRLYAAMESVRANRPLSRRDMPVWILVEKILAPGEVLDERWMVSGTTGYDFAADVGGLMHDGRGENRLFQAWSDISGDHRAPPALLAQARKELLDRNFIAERDTLLRKLMQVAANDPEAADWPQHSIGRALDTLLSHYPTYRSYVEPDVTRSEADQQWFNDALRGAQLSLEGEPEPYSEILSWLDRRLGGEAPSDKQSLQLVQRFQQLTPPLAAKALEDTVFYRYGALLSRNEVGSDPNVFSLTAEGFHERNLRPGGSFTPRFAGDGYARSQAWRGPPCASCRVVRDSAGMVGYFARMDGNGRATCAEHCPGAAIYGAANAGGGMAAGVAARR